MMRVLLIVVGLISSSKAFAAYDLYLQNNTHYPLQFNTKLVTNAECAALAPDYYRAFNGAIPAYARAPIAHINYNEGIKSGVSYCFTTNIQHNDQAAKLSSTPSAFALTTTVTGATIGSQISQVTLAHAGKSVPIFTTNPDPQLVSDNSGYVDLRVIKNALPNMELIAAATKPSLEPSLQGVNDLYFVVNATTPASATKSTALRDEPQKLSILTYNTQLMPEYVQLSNIRLNHLMTRSRLIPALITGYDVVVAEELLDASARQEFSEAMRRDYPYQYGPLNSADPTRLSGGVMVFSHWPLLKTAGHTYTNCYGIDCKAQKGVLYTQIDKHGTLYNLFATHTQADDNPGHLDADQAARRAQFGELQQFISDQSIAKHQAVILSGDLNVNYNRCHEHKQCDEYTQTIGQLSAHPPQWHNYELIPYLSDHNKNLMNTDAELASYDYNLPLKGYLLPTHVSATAWPLRNLETPEMYGRSSLNISEEAPYAVLDLSDHFALSTIFSYQE